MIVVDKTLIVHETSIETSNSCCIVIDFMNETVPL